MGVKQPIEDTEKRYRGPQDRRALMRAKGEVVSRWRQELASRLGDLGVKVDDVIDPKDDAGEKTVEFLEKAISSRDDLMSVAFLKRGAEITRAVCRIETFDEQRAHVAFATGFLVAPRILVTNHHVIHSREEAERCELQFNYDPGEGLMVVFRTDPVRFFATDPDLDYTIVAVAPISLQDGVPIESFGTAGLAPGNAAVRSGQPLNIVQHPRGELKQVAIRDNEVVDVQDAFIHYRTDTRQGSSGAPVCTDDWQVIAVHHSGVPKRNEANAIIDLTGGVWNGEDVEDIDFVANEGVRIDRILGHALVQTPDADATLRESLGNLGQALAAGQPAQARIATIPQALIGPPDLFNPAVQAAAVQILHQSAHATAPEAAPVAPPAATPPTALTATPIAASETEVLVNIPLRIRVALGAPRRT